MASFRRKPQSGKSIALYRVRVCIVTEQRLDHLEWPFFDARINAMVKSPLATISASKSKSAPSSTFGGEKLTFAMISMIYLKMPTFFTV
jgi:hypothetical protein